MIVVIHAAIAIISLLYATVAAFLPSKRKLRFLYVSMAATVISGILVAVDTEVSLGRVCLSGVVYLVYTGLMSMITRKKLATIFS